MQEKTILITGANSGLGKATAEALAKQGHHIILACRNIHKAEAARLEIIEKISDAKIDIVWADFSCLNNIRRAAEEFNNRYKKLDVLVNNTGFIAAKRELTEDGFESMFAINHLSYFLYTHLLLDALKAAPRARIVNVSSGAHRFIKEIDWNNLNFEKGYQNFKVYGFSKLCNVLFTFELAERLKDTGITVNCLHPGVVATNFGRSSSTAFNLLVSLTRPFYVSSEKGARTSVYLASSPEVEGMTGKYFDNMKIGEPTAIAKNPENAKRLWEISAKICGI
jgi:NAD(P)-dependent dehydrogenase (short-subunit alcohol dehydrogenase family)